MMDDRAFTEVCARNEAFTELTTISANELMCRNVEDLHRAREARTALKSTGFKSYKSIYHLVNRGYLKSLPVSPKELDDI